MTLEELEAVTRLMFLATCEDVELTRNAWQELERTTKEIFSSQMSAEEDLSLSSKLEEMQSRLSTLELGLKKLEQKQQTTPKHVHWTGESLDIQLPSS